MRDFHTTTAVRARNPASFSRENLIVVFILLRGLAGMLSQDNSANFSGESKVQGSFPRSLFLENTCKNFQSNLAVLAVLVLESKGLYWLLR